MANKERIQKLIKRLEKAKKLGEKYNQNDIRFCAMHYADTVFKDRDIVYNEFFDLTEDQYIKIFWLEEDDVNGCLNPSRSIDQQIANLKELLEG